MTTDGHLLNLHKFIFQDKLDRFDFGNGFTVRVKNDDTYIKNNNTEKPTIYHLDKNNHVFISYENETPDTYDKHILSSQYTETLSAISKKIDEIRAMRFVEQVDQTLQPKKVHTI